VREKANYQKSLLCNGFGGLFLSLAFNKIRQKLAILTTVLPELWAAATSGAWIFFWIACCSVQFVSASRPSTEYLIRNAGTGSEGRSCQFMQNNKIEMKHYSDKQINLNVTEKLH